MLVLLQKFEGLDSGVEAPAPGLAPGRRQFTEAALTEYRRRIWRLEMEHE